MKAMTNATNLHVVLGAGQVGPLLIEHLLAHGVRVRAVRRGAPVVQRPGLTWLSGDLRDPSFAREAVAGAAVVYNTTNPEAYHRWDELLFPLTRGIRSAVMAEGARLVALDNLYMVGRPETSPFPADTLERPCSKKGRMRKQLADELAELQAQGKLVAATGRASDFFGPGAGAMSIAGDHLAKRLASGGAVEVFGDPDLPRGYSFVPDVARGLFALGTSEASWGRVWHLPVAWKGTTRGLLESIGAAAGKKVRLRRVPDALLAVAGLFAPAVGAMREMTYQWKVPYVADDARFVETFGVAATPPDVAVRQAAAALVAMFPARPSVTLSASR
jgi:nucleoside-diphosphate-sugar epimerase